MELCSWWTSFQISSPRRPATSATDSTSAPSLSGERPRGSEPDMPQMLRPDDKDLRPDRVAGTGRDRVQAGGPRGGGRVPPRVAVHRLDREMAQRRRVDRLPGRDAEHTPEPHPVVEEQMLRVAADDDDRPEARPPEL